MNNKFKNNKLNKGFTLIEVLVAVIILSIVSIPIFRAIVTSYNTTSKSKLKMVATNAAENVMEDMKAMTLKEVIDKYGTESGVVYGTPNKKGKNQADGEAISAYEIVCGADTIANMDAKYTDPLNAKKKNLYKINDDLKDALEKDYSVSITIDPSYYKNTNNRNLSEYNTVSSTTAAIYSMSEKSEDKAYAKYEKANNEYRLANPEKEDIIPIKNALAFKQSVKRLIVVNIKSDKTFKDEEDDSIEYPEVQVDLSVSYLLTSSDNEDIIPEEYTTVKEVTRQIYDNSVSHEPFSGVFIMYNPRFGTDSKNKDNDIIIVKNNDDIECSLYVVAQNSNNSDFEKYTTKNSGMGLILEIFEDEIDDKENPGQKKQPIKLFTNLIDDEKVEKYKDVTNSDKGKDRQAPVKCYLSVDKSSADMITDKSVFDDNLYKKILSKKGSFADQDAAFKLKASTLDGQTGDASSIENRIYDVEVKVEKTTNADEWPVSVTLTGTILDK